MLGFQVHEQSSEHVACHLACVLLNLSKGYQAGAILSLVDRACHPWIAEKRQI